MPGWPGPIDKSEGFGDQAGPGPVDKSERFEGRAGLGPVDKSEGLEAGLAQGRPIVPWWIWSQGPVLQTKGSISYWFCAQLAKAVLTQC